MSKELVLYYPRDLDIVFVQAEREYIMDYIDKVKLRKLMNLTQEINDMSNGGIYDSL